MTWLATTDFYVAPASTRYHLNYAGGLLEHSLHVYDNLVRRVGEDELCEADAESVAVTALFHDLCKVNFYKKGTRNVKEDGMWRTKEVFEVDDRMPFGEHGDKSIILIQHFMRLREQEILAIAAHMGGWTTAVKGGGGSYVGKAFERSRLAVHLHIADFEASYLQEAIGG